MSQRRTRSFPVILVGFDGALEGYTGYGRGWAGMQRETTTLEGTTVRQWDREATLPDGTIIAFEREPESRR